MIVGKKPVDLLGETELDPYERLAHDLLRAARDAVAAGELGAESFFFHKRGRNIITALGGDPEGVIDRMHEEYGMSKKSLEEIVKEMRAQALRSPRQPVRVPLSGGLNLTLAYYLTYWRLSLSRLQKAVSKGEVATCRRYFGVPAEAETEKATSGNWRIVRLKWSSATQLTFLEQADGGMVAVPEGEEERYYAAAA